MVLWTSVWTCLEEAERGSLVSCPDWQKSHKCQNHSGDSQGLFSFQNQINEGKKPPHKTLQNLCLVPPLSSTNLNLYKYGWLCFLNYIFAVLYQWLNMSCLLIESCITSDPWIQRQWCMKACQALDLPVCICNPRQAIQTAGLLTSGRLKGQVQLGGSYHTSLV